MDEQNADREARREKIRSLKRRRTAALVMFGCIVIIFVMLFVCVLQWIVYAVKNKGTAAPPTPPAASIPEPENLSAMTYGPYITDAATIKSPKIAYDFSKPVPAVAEAADSFFKTVLFVGDSRLFGLSIPGAELLASGRVSVSTALNFKYEFGEGTATLAERLDARQFSAIYINMGLNELGWEYPDLFIKAYAELIDVIRETQPDAEIYIDAVFPVSSEVTAKTSYLDNKKITLYNSLLLKLASEKGCRYLDLTEVFADADGNLLEGSTTNGINPTKDYFNKWHAYLKTHTVSKEYYGN